MFYNNKEDDNNMTMKKKKYEKPSITDPETGRAGRRDYGPVGATGCSYGDIGSACVNGTSPKGNHCHVGGSPTILNCTPGSKAGNTCHTGTNAIGGCSIGSRDTSFCQNGTTAHVSCNTGTGVV